MYESGGGGREGGGWWGRGEGRVVGELELQRTPEFTFLLLEAGEITQGNHRAPLLLYTFSYFSRFYLENHHQGKRGQLGKKESENYREHFPLKNIS